MAVSNEKKYHVGVAKGDVGDYVLVPGDPGRVPAIATDGPPIPDEMVETGTPKRLPVNVRYSRLNATSWALSRYLAIMGVRPGSPGISTYSPTSPCASPMWYFFSPVAATGAKSKGTGKRELGPGLGGQNTP